MIEGIARNTIEYIEDGYTYEVELQEVIDDLERQVNLEREDHDGFITTDEMHEVFDRYFTDYPELAEWHEPLYYHFYDAFGKVIEDDEEREEREAGEYREWAVENRELMRGYIRSVV